MKEKTLNMARIVVLSFILSTAIGYSLADWAPPTGAPPLNNTPPPINVGSASQTRDGNLFLNNWLVAKKARTQSTIGAIGCTPAGPGCDAGDTLTTKDYVDGRIAALPPPAALVYLPGTIAGACPRYKNTGDGGNLGGGLYGPIWPAITCGDYFGAHYIGSCAPGWTQIRMDDWIGLVSGVGFYTQCIKD